MDSNRQFWICFSVGINIWSHKNNQLIEIHKYIIFWIVVELRLCIAAHDYLFKKKNNDVAQGFVACNFCNIHFKHQYSFFLCIEIPS